MLDDGTFEMVHRSSSRGITTLRMNPDRPDDRSVNDILGVYGPRSKRLAGQLWRGFATLGGVTDATEPAPPQPHRVAARDMPSRRSTLGRVVRGRRVDLDDLIDASCDELYLYRNSVFARHGYVFGTRRALAVFAEQTWYRPVLGVNDRTVDLTAADRANVELFVALESAWSCR